MTTEYKVLCDAFCWTSQSKTRKIEQYLNEWSDDGWELATLTPVSFLGIDVGFYLVVKRVKGTRP